MSCFDSRQIVLYGPDGRSFGLRPLAAAIRLSQAGKVTLERNRKGYVVAAHITPAGMLQAPIRTSQPKNEKYSFQQNYGTFRTWDLKHLGGSKGLNYAPEEAREAYIGTIRSVITS